MVTNTKAVPDMVGSKVDVARIVIRGDDSLGAMVSTPVGDRVVFGLVVFSSDHVTVWGGLFVTWRVGVKVRVVPWLVLAVDGDSVTEVTAMGGGVGTGRSVSTPRNNIA